MTQGKDHKKVPFIPTFDQLKVLTESKTSMGKPFSIEQDEKKVEILPTDYTFLNPANIYQSPELIALMYEATGKAPIELVSFKPERALFQVVAATVSAYVKYGNEEERNQIIVEQYEKMRSLANQTGISYENIRDEFIQQLKGKIDKPELRQLANDAKEKVKKLKETGKFPCDYCNIDEETLAAEIATSALYKKEIYPHLQKEVKDKITQSGLGLKQKSSKPIVLLLAGGSASGKGTSQAVLLEDATKANIHHKDIVLINSDSYKGLLVKPTPENSAIFSQISYPEARLVIRAMAHDIADNERANILIDQVKPIKKDFDYASQGYDVSCIYVSTKAEDALERAFLRGGEILRYEDTQGLLKGHKEVVDQVLDRIKEQASKQQPLPIKMRFVDNNVPKGSAPELFMEINFEEKKVNIFDDQKLEEFLKKQFINDKAKTYGEIYSFSGSELAEKAQIAKDKFIEQLKDLGFTIEKPKLSL